MLYIFRKFLKFPENFRHLQKISEISGKFLKITEKFSGKHTCYTSCTHTPTFYFYVRYLINLHRKIMLHKDTLDILFPKCAKSISAIFRKMWHFVTNFIIKNNVFACNFTQINKKFCVICRKCVFPEFVKFPEISGNFRKFSGNFPGNFPEKVLFITPKKCKITRENIGKYPQKPPGRNLWYYIDTL